LHQNKYQTALKKKKTKFNIILILILISTHAIKQILSEEPKPTGKLQKRKKRGTKMKNWRKNRDLYWRRWKYRFWGNGMSKCAGPIIFHSFLLLLCNCAWIKGFNECVKAKRYNYPLLFSKSLSINSPLFSHLSFNQRYKQGHNQLLFLPFIRPLTRVIISIQSSFFFFFFFLFLWHMLVG
jgi:hypothetical protein